MSGHGTGGRVAGPCSINPFQWLGPAGQGDLYPADHCFKQFRPGQLTLPESEYSPTHVHQTGCVAFVPLAIALKLRAPKRLARFGHPRELTIGIGVTMPKASVDEDRELLFAENDIRPARKLLSMKPISKARTMECSPHDHFRFRIATADPRHLRATGGIDRISRRPDLLLRPQSGR